MSTYVLIHGAGDAAFYWHLVTAELQARGHDVVAVDLPCDDDAAGLVEYADVVVEAIGDRRDLVVVAQSFGGYTAPLVCARVRVELLVLVAGMVPSPGESAEAMFAATGYAAPAVEPLDADDDGTLATFYADVPRALAAEALTHGRDQSGTPWSQPWPLRAWPEVPTRYLLCREDLLFPAEWVRGVVRERLGITPDEIDGSHCPALARPVELVDRLESMR